MNKTGIVTTAFAALMLAVPGSASARVDVSDIVSDITSIASVTGVTCDDPLIENPFLFDGDPLDYVLAPDGSFEVGGSGWLLEGAAPIAGNDPFPIRPAGDEGVLSLPSGSSATSPSMCVDLNYPTFRFVLRQLADENERLRGRLRVDSIYPESERPKWRRVAVIRPDDGEWALSDHIELAPERGGELPGARQVALRFTVRGGDGAFEIDDVYIDPRFRV